MQKLTNSQRVLAAREAGNVRRCHVVPHHGEYTVGKHSYDAVSMLLVLHPDPSIHLIKALLWHDGGERWVGDMPYPTRRENEVLCEAYHLAELGAMQEWELYEGFEEMEDDDFLWLNTIDRLELWMWCQDQVALGNHHVKHFLINLNKFFEERGDEMPKPCRDFFNDFEWDRLPENPLDLKR